MKFGNVWASLALSACMSVSVRAADIGLVEEIVAKVNGDIITRSEIDKSRRQMEAELKARGTKGPDLEKILAEREKDALRERIDQLLLVQKGKELGINVEPDVSKYLAELQVQSKIADPEKFQQYVREQTGQSFEDFKSEVRNGYLTQRVIRQEVGSRISIPRAELEKYYNENKAKFMREDRVFLREILVSTDGKDAAGIAAAEKKARDLSARGKKGEKFHELAKANSDAATKDQYGELGGFKRGELNKQIEDIVFAADRGFVTDPIRVANGFLILKVEERHKAGQASFEEVEQDVMNELIQPKFQPQVREFLTKLRYESFLEIKPGYVDSGAAEGKSTAWTDPAQLKPETVTKEEVASQTRNRRLLWMVPIPGTSTPVKKGKSSSK
jgi:parvulin-like peptidyl-prolyl isomerase